MIPIRKYKYIPQVKILLKIISITLKHFRTDFRFDLCHDFSFWQAETGRCIPKKAYDYEHMEIYIFTPLCNWTEFDCTKNDYPFRRYCPNKDNSCESYDQEKFFFCNKSKTCIPKGKLN